MDKAFSRLEIRSFDEDQRILRGVASSPRVDRQGDIIDPLGISFAATGVPLLRGHNPDQPIGRVRFEKPTKDGIRFEARIAKPTDPGTFKDRCDTAWAEVRSGVTDSVSVGFRPIPGEAEALPGGGTRWKRVELLELSIVPIPANADARILETRAARLAKRNRGGVRVVKLDRPVGTKHRAIKLTPEERLIGKWKADADRRAASRKRLGIPERQVKIHSVDVMLARGHLRREQRATSKPFVIRKIHRTR
jgi:HK97 family phage prohead protease